MASLRLVRLALLFGLVPLSARSEVGWYASCTIHGGIIVCIQTPEPMTSDTGSGCYKAQAAMVIAQDYAATNPDKADAIAKIMGAATDNMFRQCAWPSPRPAKFDPAG